MSESRTAEPRTREQRKADALAKLTAPVADGWVATAGEGGPALVPLTLAWVEERIVLATDVATVTARNLLAGSPARVALGGTRDVVRVDAVLERHLPAAESGVIGAAYAAQNDWDPRGAGPAYVFLLLRPERVQAWREVNEIAGRTLMRAGVWLI